MSEGGREGRGALWRRRRTIGAVAAAVLLTTALVLAIVGGSGGTAPPAGTQVAPRLVGPTELEEAAASLGHPLYWVGPRRRTRLELKVEAEGSAYLRYLPAGVGAGDPRTGFLTVGTYPVARAQAALRRLAAEEGGTLHRLGDGSLALADPAARGSVYLARPGSDLEIEVYDPAPGRAWQLVRSGTLQPVGG